MGKYAELAKRIASRQETEKYKSAEGAKQAGKEAAVKAHLDRRHGN